MEIAMKKYSDACICGFFDLLHEGHIDILRQAKLRCEHLIVAVGTDEFMRERKHKESILTYEQRVEIVKSIRYVDEVVEETDLDKISAYKKYRFNVMFAGDDHLLEPIYIQATKDLKSFGVDTVYIPRSKNISSTQIRKRIIELFCKQNQ